MDADIELLGSDQYGYLFIPLKHSAVQHLSQRYLTDLSRQHYYVKSGRVAEIVKQELAEAGVLVHDKRC